jgi:hypothetical protein
VVAIFFIMDTLSSKASERARNSLSNKRSKKKKKHCHGSSSKTPHHLKPRRKSYAACLMHVSSNLVFTRIDFHDNSFSTEGASPTRPYSTSSFKWQEPRVQERQAQQQQQQRGKQ